jgi:RNA 2',3'-cyclic 3'-phosphodiesterase
MSNIKRLFFATHIQSEKIANELLPALKTELQHGSISWAKPEQMHVTLRFFGDTPVSRIPSIEKALRTALKQCKSFEISLKHVKMFGSRYKPQVIWIGIEDNGVLKNLFAHVQSNLLKEGFPGDRQNFVPHLTLGRIKKLDNLQQFQSVLADFSEYEAEILTVKEFILFESQLFPSGAVHIPGEQIPS